MKKSIQYVYLSVIIMLSIGCIILLSILVNQRNWIGKMEIDLDDMSHQYTSIYQDNQLLYDEIDILIVKNEELNNNVTKLKKEIISLNKEISNIQAHQKEESENIKYDSDSNRDLIFSAAKSLGVDPYLAIAVSRHETGNWTSTLCKNNNNFGGMRGANGWCTYSSKIEGINAYCKLLLWYKNKGMGTIQSMAHTYCPGTESSWISAVTKMYNEEKKISTNN